MKHLLPIFLVFLVFKSASQSFSESITNLKIHSKVLNEDREIQLYTPSNYLESQKKYPVLFILDGQRYFLNGIVFQKNLTWQEVAPDFIVVGVKTDNRKRRGLFYRDSEKFIDFLKLELIPTINNDYRTLDQRVFFGWEMAAGLGVEIFSDHSEMFNGYLLASPTHLSNERLARLDSGLSNTSQKQKWIHANLGAVENWSLPSFNKMDSLFKENKQQLISANFSISENDNHYTTPLTTINEGLKSYFSDYAPIRFYSIKEYEDYGGLTALQAHYKNRADRYQVSEEIHDDTKHYLILQALKEDNFNLFKDLMNSLDGHSFIAQYYSRAGWFIRYSKFYLSNNHHEESIQLLKLALDKFPGTSSLQNEMGNCYQKSGQLKLAKKWYKEAISTAQKNGEPEFAEYQKNLDSL